jgi:hypothetical protein
VDGIDVGVDGHVARVELRVARVDGRDAVAPVDEPATKSLQGRRLAR